MVLEALHQLYPQAPIFTSIYAQEVMPEAYRSWDVRTSFMQGLPWVKRHHQPFLPLYPLAFEGFDLSSFQLVISISSAFCHGVLTPPETCHINYCLTPPRFLWNLPQYLLRERVNGLARRFLPPVVSYLRSWDVAAANRVDYFIGISRAVVARIRKVYRREAALIYPPVDTTLFAPSPEVEDYFLVLSRLVPYKRVDLVVEAFNELGLPLLIVGDGRDRPALEAKARANIRFSGHLPRQQIPPLLARCRALIFPGEEDFGIAPLEAQAAGRPVVALGAGGALETVQDGVTGKLFMEQTPQALAEAVCQLEKMVFDPKTIREHAARFDTTIFQTKMRAFIAEKLEEHSLAIGSG